MILLKAIGAFFVKIWHWIKETAWVQPLLIVGAIFAIIFSIPYITKWAQSFSGEGSGQFFKNYDVSINNEEFVPNKVVTDGDKLAQSLYKYDEMAYADAESKATTTSDYKEITDAYGEKFFLVFYKKDNSSSDNIESGLRYLKENWNNASYNLYANDETFKLWAIDTTYTSDNDSDYTTTGDSNAFNRFLYTNASLFQSAGPQLYTAPYRTRANVSETSYDQFALNNTSSSTSNALSDFPLPTVCLVDFSAKALSQGRGGLSEVLFSVTGDSELNRAQLLLNMWNHTDAYSTTNLFTKQN